ncbi:TPA: hypothetical protein G9F27_002821 [Salmonella enterica]|uniref:Uncharacterized protein n=1 Tax=Salmonella enterica TaxID=28901 RepID=A0A743P0B9_SALER|nr:hypothetical protein [Salmonella enterica]
MTNNNENILSEEIKPLLSAYFIYKEHTPYFKKAIDDYFLSMFDNINFTSDMFYSRIDTISEYLFQEIHKILDVFFKNLDNFKCIIDNEGRDYIRITPNDLKGGYLTGIENRIKESRLKINSNDARAISDFYYISELTDDKLKPFEWADGKFPIINSIFSSIISGYIIDYNDYISCFLADMIFESGYKFNSDTFNKKTDGRKGKRGPIKKNIETEKLVSAITSATVEKYPNVSDHKLTQAIQKHLYSKKIENSYNTVKKWVIARREQEGTTHNGEESYKGVISLVIP